MSSVYVIEDHTLKKKNTFNIKKCLWNFGKLLRGEIGRVTTPQGSPGVGRNTFLSLLHSIYL